MNRLRYYVLLLLTVAPLCHGTPPSTSQAQHACAGTLKAALSVGSLCFAYKVAEIAPWQYCSKNLNNFAKGIYYSGKLKSEGLSTLAVINLIGCCLYGSYKAGLSACESFKKAQASKKLEVKEETSLEDTKISETIV
ncbi:hypothetical protein H0X06_03835 [Candidatus Dependentiae bacterium]|nr:hypothetical protein [Candidatus Dependentiae bacterium]